MICSDPILLALWAGHPSGIETRDGELTGWPVGAVTARFPAGLPEMTETLMAEAMAWTEPAADRAARLLLPRATFFLAVDAALDLDPATDGYADEYLQAVVEADASAQTPALTAEQRVLAVTLIRTATQFARADASKTLLEAIGAMVGLSSANLDTLFLEAAGL